MSDQLVSWLWCIAGVLSPIALILHLVRRILCELHGITLVVHKIRRVLRPSKKGCKRTIRRMPKKGD
jgi:DNA-binding winged helix-turn-helix (wHTH) protein